MECIFKARDQLEKIWKLSEMCGVEGSARNRFVSAMLFVSLNHCDAIQLLAQRKNFASAYALLRPLFETTFRAIWLHRCASDDQVEKCRKKDEWGSSWDLVREIEAHKGHAPVFSRMWEDLRPFMHSFTHGGVQNAVRQLGDGNYITPNLPQEEVIQLMQKVGLFSWSILGELIDLSGNESLIHDFESLGIELRSWALNNARQ